MYCKVASTNLSSVVTRLAYKHTQNTPKRNIKRGGGKGSGKGKMGRLWGRSRKVSKKMLAMKPNKEKSWVEERKRPRKGSGKVERKKTMASGTLVLKGWMQLVIVARICEPGASPHPTNISCLYTSTYMYIYIHQQSTACLHTHTSHTCMPAQTPCTAHDTPPHLRRPPTTSMCAWSAGYMMLSN